MRFPEQLRVEVDVATGLPLPNEPWLTVAVGSQEQPGGSEKSARLVVTQGTANAPELPLDKPRVHIGREVDVYRDGGMRPAQRPGVFAEDTDDQPLRLARARTYRLRQHDRRIPPVQRPLVSRAEPIAARASCATA